MKKFMAQGKNPTTTFIHISNAYTAFALSPTKGETWCTASAALPKKIHFVQVNVTLTIINTGIVFQSGG